LDFFTFEIWRIWAIYEKSFVYIEIISFRSKFDENWSLNETRLLVPCNLELLFHIPRFDNGDVNEKVHSIPVVHGETLDNRQVILGNGSSPGFTNQNQN